MKIERFKDLQIWQKARELCKQVFEITSTGLFSSDFRFRDQIYASSGSVMDNIAEGFERGGNMEFIQFLFRAKGSCGEVRSHVHRAFDYEYNSQEICDELIVKSKISAKR